MTIQDRSDWLTVDDAAKRLGVSPATIKRRIADGKPIKLPSGDSVEIEPEKLERPQGHEWRVRLRGALPALSTDPEHTDSEEPPSAQEQPAAITEAYVALVADVRALERQVGTLAAERDAALARVEAETARANDLAERLAWAELPWWRKLRGRPAD